MRDVSNLSASAIERGLAYAGLALLGFELVKRLVVGPIKAFYAFTTVNPSSPFASYEQDVRSRHNNEFEACLLYLRDFMEAIDSEDMLTIQSLRAHRNDLAHELVDMLPELRPGDYRPLWSSVERTLFKLSNHRVRMDIGADPEFASLNIEWDKVRGAEHIVLEHVLARLKLFE